MIAHEYDINLLIINDPVAQWLRHRFAVQDVAGSNHVNGHIGQTKNRISENLAFFFLKFAPIIAKPCAQSYIICLIKPVMA